jgi:hypothetical protein
MQKGFVTGWICSVAIAGQMHAQEVIVARETKPDAPKQASPTSERVERESATPAETKPRVREKKSAPATPTVEQMRMAGALAAERLNRTVPQASAAGGSESGTARAGTPTVSGRAKPVRKEARAEQTSPSRESKSRSTKSEEATPVRPTMMESGREERPTPSPAKAEARDEQNPAPQSANQSPRKLSGHLLSQLLGKPPREKDTIVP